MSLDDTTQDTPVKLCECGCGQPTPPAAYTMKSRGWVIGQPIRFIHGHNRHRPAVERFWEKVNKNAPNGCWEWAGSRMRSGHGQIHIDGKSKLVHRFAWELNNGPIPDDLEVCHHCDNPCCVNPAHLFLGTQTDNMADMMSKVRQARGARHSQAKLTEAQVVEIRRRYVRGVITYKMLAAEYGVGTETIALIIQRKNWAHI